MATLAPTLPAVLVAEGAHHLDLRAANPLDPQSVLTARATEVATLKAWIAAMKPARHL